MRRDLIIVGGGCAGYTAALYAARAGLQPLCIEGYAAGGLLMTTTAVENFPGFLESVEGPDLVMAFRGHAERFGAEFLAKDVTAVDLSGEPFTITAGGVEYESDALVIATGAVAKELGLPSELALQGRGVAYCSVCDGAFFRDRKVLVVGGGDAAMEEAMSLSKIASEVVLVHRRRDFRASKVMVDAARERENISFLTPFAVEEILGEDVGRVVGARLRDLETGEERIEDCDGVFVAVGHVPSTGLLRGSLDLDAEGYVVVEPGSTRTSVPGVFAAGDVQDRVYRQAVTAAACGAMAALDANRWLARRDRQGADLASLQVAA